MTLIHLPNRAMLFTSSIIFQLQQVQFSYHYQNHLKYKLELNKNNHPDELCNQVTLEDVNYKMFETIKDCDTNL